MSSDLLQLRRQRPQPNERSQTNPRLRIPCHARATQRAKPKGNPKAETFRRPATYPAYKKATKRKLGAMGQSKNTIYFGMQIFNIEDLIFASDSAGPCHSSVLAGQPTGQPVKSFERRPKCYLSRESNEQFVNVHGQSCDLLNVSPAPRCVRTVHAPSLGCDLRERVVLSHVLHHPGSERSAQSTSPNSDCPLEPFHRSCQERRTPCCFAAFSVTKTNYIILLLQILDCPTYMLFDF